MAQHGAMHARRTFRIAADGAYETSRRGLDVLEAPVLNKGSAFTLEERTQLGLHGLLPTAVTTIDLQAERSYEQYRHQGEDLAKHLFLDSLHDRNEVLYYRVLSEHLAEMLPIVYTPTVGEAIERYSKEFQRPRGVYLCVDDPDGIDVAFENFGAGADADDIDLIVATDAEQILGIGDWGVGGMAISVGKLAVYTAAAGIDPIRVIPVMLDVGTDREELLAYAAYMGARHRRVRGDAYDEFIDRFVRSATSRFPNAIIHWEDFGASNARRILERYRERTCTFNDDMQGTAAVVLGGVIAAVRAAESALAEQRVVIFGAGTAGIGIADFICSAMVREGVTPGDAKSRLWCLGSHGLLVEGMGMRDFQRAYARREDEARTWHRDGDDIGLLEVVRAVQPTVLIGCAAQPRSFTEAVVREMAAHTARPIIFALSNPTSLSEAAPSDLITWSDGRALVATGSPFPPVEHAGVTYVIGQANNALVFPGLGLGTVVARARVVSDGMLLAAADTVAESVDASRPGSSVMPAVEEVRAVSLRVAAAVARAAEAEGLARADVSDAAAKVRSAMWEPAYRVVRSLTAGNGGVARR